MDYLSVTPLPCRPARGMGSKGALGSKRDSVPIPFPLQIKIIKRLSLRQAAEQDLVQIYQYKIQDRNVTFFARGLSAAVL